MSQVTLGRRFLQASEPAVTEDRRNAPTAASDGDPQLAAASDRDDQPDTGLVGTLRAVDAALGRVEQALLVLFLVVLVAVGAGQAIATKLGAGWAWSFEVIRYSVFFIAMTGAALSAHTEQLISMDFVTRLLSARGRARLTLGLRVFTLAVSGLLVAGGFALRDAAGASLYHVINPRLGLLALPIGAGLMGVHILLHLIIDAADLRHGRVSSHGLDAHRSGH